MDWLSVNSAYFSCVVLVLTWVYHKFVKSGDAGRKSRYPPGPNGLPLLGNLLQLGTTPHLTFKKWRDRYGPVFSWKMATMNAVVISDLKLLKELFSKEGTTGRLLNPIIEVHSSRLGIINSEGRNWGEQRAFALKTLKTLSKGGILEGILLEEGKRLVKYFERQVNTPVEINGKFLGATLNSIWTLISGESNDWTENPDLPHIETIKEINEAFNNTVETGLMFAPWLRHVMPEKLGFNRVLRASHSFMEMASAVVSKHLGLNRDSNTYDFIGEYLRQAEGVGDPHSSFFQDVGKKNLCVTVSDVFSAGTETTSTTLEFAILYLSVHPQVQVEMQRELDSVCGSRLPSLSDKWVSVPLPYTEAVILETLRRSSIVAMGVPHKTLEDLDFHDYFIPKGTIVFPDIYGIQMSPAVWNDPHNFRPERFLNADKSGVIRHEALIPFCVGRRMCIGDGMAREALFLLLACLLQRFTIKSCGRDARLDDILAGFTLRAKPFQVVFKLRE